MRITVLNDNAGATLPPVVYLVCLVFLYGFLAATVRPALARLVLCPISASVDVLDHKPCQPGALFEGRQFDQPLSLMWLPGVRLP